MNTTSLAPGLPKTAVANAVLRAMSACATLPSAAQGRPRVEAPQRPPATSTPSPRRAPLPAPLKPKAASTAPAHAPARGAAPPAASPGNSDPGVLRTLEGDRTDVDAAVVVLPSHARPQDSKSLLGAALPVAPRQRPSIYAVRRAVSKPRAREDSLVEIDLHEANRVLERLQHPLGAARGHKFAVGLRRASDGMLDAAAVCAAPVAAALQDGLTTELRRLAVGLHAVDGYARLLDGIADEAASMGYRRLVTYLRVGLTAQTLVDAGWSRLPACSAGAATGRDDGRGDDAGSAWTKVLRGEHRSR